MAQIASKAFNLRESFYSDHRSCSHRMEQCPIRPPCNMRYWVDSDGNILYVEALWHGGYIMKSNLSFRLLKDVLCTFASVKSLAS